MNVRERLEVEDEDERQKRLGQLLMRVDQAGDNTLNAIESSTTLLVDQIGGPVPVEPPTEQLSVLDRVRHFLPQLAESNASLSSRDQQELDIENVSDGGSYYIEMVMDFNLVSSLTYLSQNLGLGVFEYMERGRRSDEGSSASSLSSSMSALDSGDGDGSSSGSSSCSEDSVQLAVRPKKPLPRRATPSITVLSNPENPPGGSSVLTDAADTPPNTISA
ncbi:hypothetical protein BDM02DRAFT_3261312 [Thelephora ganbajun]|uniref:Uncharacterized protein n=1 Tax=Thelephora ganbajun TaxID=370292 RepID=A0ACB6ZF20_THEGA|nr:hypothetical protein BDM02DRAFT_3261312 [Thelephora ganbajun]